MVSANILKTYAPPFKQLSCLLIYFLRYIVLTIENIAYSTARVKIIGLKIFDHFLRFTSDLALPLAGM
jgi:hypothetical protein